MMVFIDQNVGCYPMRYVVYHPSEFGDVRLKMGGAENHASDFAKVK